MDQPARAEKRGRCKKINNIADLQARLRTPRRKVKLVFPRELREELERECGFTDDEIAVLRLCCRGWGYVQISENLHCSPETVRNRIRSIKDKIIDLGSAQPPQ